MSKKTDEALKELEENSYVSAPRSKFVYGDKVIVKNGFYRGMVGEDLRHSGYDYYSAIFPSLDGVVLTYHAKDLDIYYPPEPKKFCFVCYIFSFGKDKSCGL